MNLEHQTEFIISCAMYLKSNNLKLEIIYVKKVVELISISYNFSYQIANC